MLHIQLICNHPMVLIRESWTPCAAAVVATSIQKLWPANMLGCMPGLLQNSDVLRGGNSGNETVACARYPLYHIAKLLLGRGEPPVCPMHA